MATSRPYTGFDGNATRRLAGTERLMLELNRLTDNAVWHLGSWVVRSKRGKSSPSVHGTGRAIDISWREMRPDNKGSGLYSDAVKICDFLVEHSEQLGIEAVYDYFPKPWARGWKCDRQKWISYDHKVMSYTPGGDWLHVEISPEHADDENWYALNIPRLWGTPSKRIFVRKSTVKKGSKGKTVAYMQEQLNRHDHQCEPCSWELKVDGKFGPITDAAVREFQGNHREVGRIDIPERSELVVDGICGPQTWWALDDWADEVL